MDRVDRFTAAGIAGGLLLLASFIIYVFVPSPVFIGTFAVGVVLLIAGYVLIHSEHKAASAKPVKEPFIIDLSGDYKPDFRGAEIEELC